MPKIAAVAPIPRMAGEPARPPSRYCALVTEADFTTAFTIVIFMYFTPSQKSRSKTTTAENAKSVQTGRPIFGMFALPRSESSIWSEVFEHSARRMQWGRRHNRGTRKG
jgi:hypothetical protein